MHFDWQAKQRHIAVVDVREPVCGWAALEGSEGKRAILTASQ
jgi:hypothetical protein